MIRRSHCNNRHVFSFSLSFRHSHKALYLKMLCVVGRVYQIFQVMLGTALVIHQQTYENKSSCFFVNKIFHFQFNWYSKRLLLAAVYKSAEIYLLQDQSLDKIDTMNFLERRLNDFQAFGSVRNTVSKSFSDTAQIVNGLFSVVRNLTSRRQTYIQIYIYILIQHK